MTIYYVNTNGGAYELTPKLGLQTDFTDYYDYLCIQQDKLINYVRRYSNSLSKGKALMELRKIGVKTIHLASVQEIAPSNKKVVVYTDPKKHRGEGKILMSSNDAMITYPTNLCSAYNEDSFGVTNKFLQIGKRRFRIIVENTEPLKEGRAISIDEIAPEYNFNLRLPIFSIDYISTSGGLLAVDFNIIQELKHLNIQNILKPEIVVAEIYESIIKYGNF